MWRDSWQINMDASRPLNTMLMNEAGAFSSGGEGSSPSGLDMGMLRSVDPVASWKPWPIGGQGDA